MILPEGTFIYDTLDHSGSLSMLVEGDDDVGSDEITVFFRSNGYLGAEISVDADGLEKMRHLINEALSVIYRQQLVKH